GTVERHAHVQPGLAVFGGDTAQRGLDALAIRRARKLWARFARGFGGRVWHREDGWLAGMDVALRVVGHVAQPADILGLLIPYHGRKPGDCRPQPPPRRAYSRLSW